MQDGLLLKLPLYNEALFFSDFLSQRNNLLFETLKYLVIIRFRFDQERRDDEHERLLVRDGQLVQIPVV